MTVNFAPPAFWLIILWTMLYSACNSDNRKSKEESVGAQIGIFVFGALICTLATWIMGGIVQYLWNQLPEVLNLGQISMENAWAIYGLSLLLFGRSPKKVYTNNVD